MLSALALSLTVATLPLQQAPQSEAQQREELLGTFRATCAGTAATGGVGQIHNTAIPAADRQEFGWTLYRWFSMFQTDPAVRLTSDDRECGEVIRRGLAMEGLDAGLDEQVAADRLRVGAGSEVARERSPSSATASPLLSEFRAVCAGSHEKGRIERILDRTESFEVRKLFGWTLIRMAVAGALDGAQLTPEDYDCVGRVRDMLRQEGMYEGLNEQLEADARAAGQ